MKFWLIKVFIFILCTFVDGSICSYFYFILNDRSCQASRKHLIITKYSFKTMPSLNIYNRSVWPHYNLLLPKISLLLSCILKFRSLFNSFLSMIYCWISLKLYQNKILIMKNFHKWTKHLLRKCKLEILRSLIQIFLLKLKSFLKVILSFNTNKSMRQSLRSAKILETSNLE